jgi:hypothetical protein
MPFLIPLLLVGGTFAVVQADDLIEGGKQQTNTLLIGGLALAAYYLWNKKGRK